MGAKEIAYGFINLFRYEDEALTNLKLQKLLYYAQGFSYQRYGKPLFDDELEAWDNGPVVYDVYQRYKACGSNPIRVYEEVDLSDEEEQLILDVSREYGKYHTEKLVSMTHKPGTPWRQVYIHNKYRNVIPKHLIEEYFTSTEPKLNSLNLIDILGSDIVDVSNGGNVSSEDWVYE